ncbi:MAG: hypothetical protein ACI4TM_05340 [Candidatus Cryptobacteroides sp.]
MTDKEIREFIKTNAVQVGDGDRFMKELVRRMDCLPEPSVFREKTIDYESKLELMGLMMKKWKRNELLKGVTAAVMSVLLSAAVLVIVWMLTAVGIIPMGENGPLSMLPWLISGLCCILALVCSLKVTDLLEI